MEMDVDFKFLVISEGRSLFSVSHNLISFEMLMMGLMSILYRAMLW
jgi:hypothetical protein